MLGARAAPLLARAVPTIGRLATRVGPKALQYGIKYGPDVIGALGDGDAQAQDDDLMMIRLKHYSRAGFGKMIGKFGKGGTKWKVRKMWWPWGDMKSRSWIVLVGRLFPPSRGSNDNEGDDAALLQDKEQLRKRYLPNVESISHNVCYDHGHNCILCVA